MFALGLDDPVTRDGAAAAARRELARREYHQDDPSVLERAFTWVIDRLGNALARTTAVAPGGGVGLVVLAVLVIVAVVLVRLRLGALPVRDLLRDRSGTIRGMTAADYRADAERLAGQGDWAEALRARTRAVVRELEARGVIEPRPGRTAAGVAREAASTAPASAVDVTLVARLFDEVWYGGRAATENDVGQARAADERLRRMRLAVVPDAPAPGALRAPA